MEPRALHRHPLTALWVWTCAYVEETTNDVTDQFVRRMGLFAKGKISGFDYRFSVTNPLPVQTAITVPGTTSVAALPVLPSAAGGTSQSLARHPALLN